MKFVNDVFLNGKKVCGVLSRMESQGDIFKLVIGVGVNLNTHPDLVTATSVLVETGLRLSVAEFTESLTWHLVYFLDKLETEGFQGEVYRFIATQMYLLGD